MYVDYSSQFSTDPYLPRDLEPSKTVFLIPCSIKENPKEQGSKTP